MRVKAFITTIVLALCIHTVSYSKDKIAGKIAQIEIKFKSGYYDVAEKAARSLAGKLSASSSKSDKVHYSELLYLQAEIAIIQSGDIGIISDLLNKGTRKLQTLGDQSPEYILGLAQEARVYVIYGDLVEAKNKLELALRKIDQMQDVERLKHNLSLVEMKLLSAMGYHEKAHKIGVNELTFLKNNIQPTYEYKDPKSGQTKRKKYKKKDYLSLKREYAFHLNDISANLFSWGNWPRLDSALTEHDQWIQAELSTADIAYNDHLFWRAQWYSHKDKTKEDFKAANSIFINEMSKASGKYGYKYLTTSIPALMRKAHQGYIMSGKVMNFRKEFETKYKNPVHTGLANLPAIDGSKRRGKNPQYLLSYIIDAEINILVGDYGRAKKWIENGLAHDWVPQDHPYRRKLLQLAVETNIKLDDKGSTNKYLDQLLSITGKLIPEGCPEYHKDQLLKAVAQFEFNDDYPSANDIFEVSYTQSVRKELSPGHSDWIHYGNKYADLMLQEDNYEAAAKWYNESYKILDKQFDKIQGVDMKQYKHYLPANQLVRMSRMYLEKGEFVLASKMISETYSTFNPTSNETYDERPQSELYWETLALINLEIGNFEAANEDLEKAKKCYSNSAKKYLNHDLHFADLNIKLGKYALVRELLYPEANRISEVFGEANKRMLPIQKTLSTLSLEEGDYPGAEKHAEEALAIADNVFGDNSTEYAKVLYRQALVHMKIGDYKDAIKDLRKVMSIIETKSGQANLYFAKALSDEAIARLYAGEHGEDVLGELKKAYKLIEQAAGKEPSIAKAEILQNQVFFYIEIGDYPKAQENIKRVQKIWLEILSGSKNKNSKLAELWILEGLIYQAKGEFNSAKKSFEKAADFYKQYFENHHPEQTFAQSRLGQMYYLEGDFNEAIKKLSYTTAETVNYINKYFQYQSERQKQRYWEKVSADFEFFCTLAFNDGSDNQLANVYNNVLATKNILLNSNIQIRESIQNSSDTLVQANFNSYQKLKEKLTRSLSMSTEQLKSELINIEKLEQEVSLLEKKLSESSNLFASKGTKHDEFTWKDVRDGLEDDEYAVEIIRYRYFKETFTDSIIYAALIIHNKTKGAPELVTFPNGFYMENKGVKFYKNTTKFKIPDSDSYNVFWGPIQDKIGDNKTIYLSADGIYSQLNLETLQTPKGDYVIDHANIVLINNTKDIAIRHKRKKEVEEKNKKLSILLVGNPSFYPDNDANTNHKNTSNTQSVKQLPGAELEIKEISEFAKANGWNATTLLYTDATEKSVKQGPEQVPDVVHIATHGFFKQDRKRKTSITAEFDDNKFIEDPLLKSGLILYNGGTLIDSEDLYAYNKEDGILTAREAQNLNLQGTKLVILSACETGLGETRNNGQGVAGLQTAIQIAGANGVIMSLFKVNDEVTQKLMRSLYKNCKDWSSDKEIRRAFIAAKKEVREEYQHPIFWGTFIMVGLSGE